MKIEKKQKMETALFNKKAAKKVIAASITAALLLGSGMHCAKAYIPTSNDPTIKLEQTIDETEAITTEFEKGEHIIAVEIDNPHDTISQIPYHAGYKFKGLAYDSSLKYALYVNDETVSCVSNGTDSAGNYVYTDFGKPKETTQESDIFDSGDHVITVPITYHSNNVQFEYHDGYEAIDIAEYVCGRLGIYGGGFIVYANTVPVKCEKNQNGEYVEFGTPIEKEKVKTLK